MISIHRTILLSAIFIFTAAACGSPKADDTDGSDTFELSDAGMIDSGREIVEAQCANCHAIGADDTSTRPDAPPLRYVLNDFAPDALAWDFRERIHVGHPDMPDFDFGPIGTDHVIAYLKSIQVTPEAAE